MADNRVSTQPVGVLAGVFKVSVVGLTLGVLGANALLHPESVLKPQLVVWAGIAILIELLPVPIWHGMRLSLSFPILLGVAFLYTPPVAATVAFVGTFRAGSEDGKGRVVRALVDRSQIALSVLTGSAVYHAIASSGLGSPWYLLIPAVLAAVGADYAANVALVATYMRLAFGIPVAQVLARLRLGALSEFLLSYVGLGFVGLVIALLYQEIGFFAVFVFVLPLVFARQMFFRTLALEEATKELKDREQVLRALSNRMAEERQDERMQVAAYLHDDLAQVLFRLNLQVEMAKKRLATRNLEGVDTDLDRIASSKQEASDMIRSLVRDLHRSPIGRSGLAEAIRSFAEDSSRGSPTEIRAEVVEVSLPPPIQLLIYQIAREATMNAMKHAGAGHIWITLSEVEDGVELQIRDDGRGFDTLAAPPEGHFGTIMMRERAQVVGGTFGIQSQPGFGTTISARFPSVWVEEGTRLEKHVGSRDDLVGQGVYPPPEQKQGSIPRPVAGVDPSRDGQPDRDVELAPAESSAVRQREPGGPP